MSLRQPASLAMQRLALLFPAAVIAGFTLGRGIGNLALFGLLCFAVYLLLKTRISLPRWLGLPAAFLGVLAGSLFWYGIDLQKGAEVWLMLALSLFSALAVTLAADTLRIHDGLVARGLFLLSGLALFAYLLRAGYYMAGESFNPAFQLNGLHLAALLPLGLIALRARLQLVLGYAALNLAALLIGDSRTEIMMLLLGVAASLLFQYRRIGWMLLGIPATFGAVLAYGYALRGYGNLFGGDIHSLLNDLSSHRWVLWQMALDHPPANPLFGAGSGQSPFYFARYGYEHLSFHNAFIEVWFDGGWIGLLLLLLAIVLPLRKLPLQYRQLGGQARWAYACFFGAIVASLVACLLDRGYSTTLFNVFLFYCLVVLWRQPEGHADHLEARAKP